MAKLNSFQLHLLKRLQEAREPVSAQTLAGSLGVSERTVRSHLKSLGQDITGCGATLCSKTGSGYWLEISDRETFDDLIQNTDEVPTAFAMNAIRQARAHLLVRYLLCQEGYVKTEELESILFMGRTAVQQLLSRAKTILARSGLEITTKSRQGMMVTGAEQNIRTCLVYEGDQIARLRIPLAAREQYAEIYDFQGEKMEKVKELVRDALGKLASLSVYSIDYLSRLIWVSAIRDGAGKSVSYSIGELIDLENSKFYPSVSRLLEKCGQVLEWEPARADAALLTGAVRGLRVVLDPAEISREVGCRYREIAAEVMAKVAQANEFKMMCGDELLLDDLTCYLAGLFARSKYHIRTAQLSKEISAQGSLMAKKMALQTFCFLHEKYSINISEEEILRLAMIIRPLFGRFPNYTSQLKACCVSDVDRWVGHGMAERLERNFGKYLRQLDVMEPYELKEQGGGEYEVVFTSCPLAQFDYLPEATLLIPVGPFFNEEDKVRIQRTLGSIDLGTHFGELLKPGSLFVGEEAFSQEECFAMIEDRLRKILPVRGKLKEDLEQVEIDLTSCPRNNVVILSGLEPHLPQAAVAVFVLKRPIQWGSEDSKAQAVIYWDQGMEGENGLFENEFLPHLLERAFYDQDTAAELLRRPDYGEILKALESKEQGIYTMATRQVRPS